MNARRRILGGLALATTVLLAVGGPGALVVGRTGDAVAHGGVEALLRRLAERRASWVTTNDAGEAFRLFVPSNLVTDENLRVLRDLPGLTDLTLRLRPDLYALSAAGLSELQSLTNLEHLSIDCAGNLPAGMFRAICHCRRLRSLVVGRVVPPTAEYTRLTNLLHLRELSILEGPSFGDAELRLLTALPRLEKLRLAETAVSAEWPAFVRLFPSLSEATVSIGYEKEILTWTRRLDR